jgi:flagellum-specific peptidoglycan hydrolase FlgJ
MYKLSLIVFGLFWIAQIGFKPTELAPIKAAQIKAARPKLHGINKAEIGLLLTKYARQSSKLEFAYFVQNWAGYAKKLQDETAIPIAIILGVALLETGGGQSDIARNSHNLFNIKALKTELAYVCQRGVRWAKYDSKEQSFAAFVGLVSGYNLGEVTPHSFAQSPYIAGANKATRERYKADLERIISDYRLDKIALPKIN